MRKPRERTEKSGPTQCMRSKRLSANCTICGQRPEVVHSPLRLRGFYCDAHCPECAYRTT
jgi:hypothetical protein